MAVKRQSSRTKGHPDLGKLDVTVTEFGEISGSMDIDKINKFLDKNVEDKKLSKDQITADSE